MLALYGFNLLNSWLAEIVELKRAISAIHSEISRLNVILADHKNKEAVLQSETYTRESEAIEREGEIEMIKQQGEH